MQARNRTCPVKICPVEEDKHMSLSNTGLYNSSQARKKTYIGSLLNLYPKDRPKQTQVRSDQEPWPINLTLRPYVYLPVMAVNWVLQPERGADKQFSEWLDIPNATAQFFPEERGCKKFV